MKKSRKHNSRKPETDRVRNAILITRVSTLRQAENDEGSLKNQLQRLRGYMDYRRTCGEDWHEVAHIELRGISGKTSLQAPEFQPAFELIRTGQANTVLCPALDRVARNVMDFLQLFAFLNEHGVQVTSLRESFDTSTPQGRFVATILIAMAQMEREIASQRTTDAMADQSQRGLWNGSQLLGYDLDPERPGYLLPNEREALLVNLAFDLYLELGSIQGVADELNARGYRTKSYTSRRGKFHPGSKFTISSIQHLLKNVAYIAKKEVMQLGESGQEE